MALSTRKKRLLIGGTAITATMLSLLLIKSIRAEPSQEALISDIQVSVR